MITLFFLEDLILWPAAAILGMIVGYRLGQKVRDLSPNAPAWCAVGVGCLFSAIVKHLIGPVIIGLILFILWKFRILLRHAFLVFCDAAGISLHSILDMRPLSSKIRRLEHEHAKRLSALYEMDIPPKKLNRLVESEDNRFHNELQHLTEGDQP